MGEGLSVEQQGPVLVATIDRQERMNALNQEIYDAFVETWKWAASEPSLRSIVVTGAGERAFCTGMDLKDFAERGGPRPVKADVHEELRLTPLHCDVWLPTIIAVNGVCTGAGLHFISDADVVIASSNASFLDTHVTVGQVAAVEPISLLPRIGLGNALRLTVLGRHGRMSAHEALRIGMVDEVVDPHQLRERAIELAQHAASGSPAAIEASKRAIRGALEQPMHVALQEGWELLLEHRNHPDSFEGPIAFAEKRDPTWQ
jgi:enoyl-CoA hydratase/carnithine racemase